MRTLIVATRALLALALLALAATGAFAQSKDRESGPQWASLTADQQQILAPLQKDWPKLSREQKAKWLGIAKRYPKMTPVGQKRVQTRMEKWVKLTPEQRMQARERYRNIATKVAPDRKEQLRRYWVEYQSLPPHERRMFDVPPSYRGPEERRKHARQPKQHPKPPFALP
jgi:hypothetical protein